MLNKTTTTIMLSSQATEPNTVRINTAVLPTLTSQALMDHPPPHHQVDMPVRTIIHHHLPLTHSKLRQTINLLQQAEVIQQIVVNLMTA